MKLRQLFLAGAGLASAAFAQDLPQLGQASIDEVINAMTLDEKVLLLIGTGMDDRTDGSGAVVGSSERLVPGAAGTIHAIPRLGIPSIVLADGPAGLRIDPTREGDNKTYYATHFPIGTLLASTWDTDLVEKVGKAIGNEVLEYGVDVLLAPGMNIQRHPLNGRNFEYYSEDPLLSGKIAAAYVRGVQANNVGTSVKHFVANNQETNRTATDAIISQRALREIYLKGFEIALKESDPWTLMTSYNLLNGIYTSENPELLIGILRDEWKYSGMVMTDWFGGTNAPAQVAAGNDMLQPGYRKQYDAIVEAVRNGKLEMKDIDRNVRRILELILKTPRFLGYKFSDSPDLASHAALTRESATEGMILLKNQDKVLPLKSDIKKIALFGNTSYDFIPGGTGSGNVNRAYTVSLLQGLENADYIADGSLQKIYEKHIAAEKIRLAPNDSDFMARFMPPTLPDELAFSIEDIRKYAAANDAAIITVGRNSGEFLDRPSKDFYMSGNMLDLIENVSKIFHEVGKPVMVILNVGGAVETASWKEKPNAILLAWQGGQEGGNSVADILSGKANPSGKLTMTFPLNVTDPYSSVDFPIDADYDAGNFMDMERKRGNVRNVDYTLYEDDIYVGYRYFSSFDKPVSYPFGFGLSYTSFEYSHPEIARVDDKFIISVEVENNGDRAGREIVELYVTAPDARKSNKPEIELKAFGKTGILQPGETQKMELVVEVRNLASFDEQTSSWVVNDGEYEFKIGASSEDIRYILKSMVEACSWPVDNVLAPRQPLENLKR